MRRRGRGGGWKCATGIAAVLLGVLIILGMVLPTGFWWVLAALALIAGGICWISAC